MLIYGKTNHLEAVSYSNSNFVRCIDTRKFTFDYLFLLREGEISWKSAKQYVITLSSMQVEFVAYFEATIHVLWLWNFILGLGVIDTIAKSLKIYCDNSTQYSSKKIINAQEASNIWN